MVRVPWLFRAHQGLQRRLAIVVLLAVVALVLADGLSLRNAREQAVSGAYAESTNLARSLSDQTSAVFQLTDSFVLGLRDRLEADGTSPAALQRLSGPLTLLQKTLFMLRGAAVLDANGQVLAQYGASLPANLANATAGYFRHHQTDAARTAFLGWPAIDPRDGRWQITISCRLEDPGHDFAGVVVASLPVDYFETMFYGYDVGPRGVISMLRADGIQIARRPLTSGVIGRFIEPLTHGPDRDITETTSPIDGRVRLNSYVWLKDVPILLLVGHDKAVVLAAWWKTVFAHAICGLLVLGALAALTRRLARSIGESEAQRGLLEQGNAQLAESEARTVLANAWLEMSESLAHVGHWHLSLQEGHTLVWSDEVYRLHGLEKRAFLPAAEDVVEAYHPEDRPLVREAITEAIASGRPFELLVRILWPDGSTRYVLTRGCYLPDPPGAPPSVFGVIMDVTDQKLIEAALLDAKATADTANMALESANRALHALAMQDALTGLANRRHFDRSLDHEFRRAMRGGSPLALVLLDVDWFKQFNDQYGHQAGDMCLQSIARAIPALLNRPGDIAARYGGEEIALLLPGTTLDGARALAERVAATVRRLAIPHAGSEHGVVTVSAGVEAFVPVRDVDKAAQLIEHADLALYAAKHAGRDKVVSFHECAADARIKV